MEDETQPEVFEVWPENEGALDLFVMMGTQWRVVARTTGLMVLGLDYTAAGTLMRVHGMKNRAQLFDQLRTMEAAALAVLNKKG